MKPSICSRMAQVASTGCATSMKDTDAHQFVNTLQPVASVETASFMSSYWPCMRGMNALRIPAHLLVRLLIYEVANTISWRALSHDIPSRTVSSLCGRKKISE
jgi:hypothetical protein